MTFKHIPHMADVIVQASGSTLALAFSEMARGMTAIMTEEVVDDALEFSVSLRAESLEALLFDFLSELVILLDTEQLFVARAELTIDESSCSLSGMLFGDRANLYERHGDVKAPTYHELFVKKDGDGWLLQATLDL